MYIVTYTVEYEGSVVIACESLKEARKEAERIKNMNCMGDFHNLQIYKAELVEKIEL